MELASLERWVKIPKSESRGLRSHFPDRTLRREETVIWYDLIDKAFRYPQFLASQGVGKGGAELHNNFCAPRSRVSRTNCRCLE